MEDLNLHKRTHTHSQKKNYILRKCCHYIFLFMLEGGSSADKNKTGHRNGSCQVESQRGCALTSTLELPLRR